MTSVQFKIFKLLTVHAMKITLLRMTVAHKVFIGSKSCEKAIIICKVSTNIPRFSSVLFRPLQLERLPYHSRV